MKSEAQIQSECVIWMWNENPETRGLFFAITNNSENIGRAMQRKSLGLIPGVADTCFLWDRIAYFFEFKTETGRQSVQQKEWERKVKDQNFDYFIIRSVDEFKKIITQILE